MELQARITKLERQLLIQAQETKALREVVEKVSNIKGEINVRTGQIYIPAGSTQGNLGNFGTSPAFYGWQAFSNEKLLAIGVTSFLAIGNLSVRIDHDLVGGSGVTSNYNVTSSQLNPRFVDTDGIEWDGNGWMQLGITQSAAGTPNVINVTMWTEALKNPDFGF